MQDAIYSGYVSHRRLLPKTNFFKYKVNMFLLDIDKISQCSKKYWFFSYNKFNLLSFNDKSYLSNYEGTLLERVCNALSRGGYNYSPGKVFILTNLSYFGYCYNPVSFYYCYNSGGSLEYILAEVNNTPWNERYVYALECQQGVDSFDFSTKKDFHVSPFMPMNLDYKWKVNNPGKDISIHIQLYDDAKALFDAKVFLHAKPINYTNLLKSVIYYPLMTHKVLFGIYWQALKMWLRKFKFYAYQRNNDAVR